MEGLQEYARLGKALAIPSNLIVNYLPPSINSDEALKLLFAPYGEVESCKLMINKHTGESLGYGFVKFTDSDSNAPTQAIAALNGKMLENKRLKVNYARPSAAVQSTPTQTQDRTPNTNLYVSRLGPNITKEMLDEIFSPFGTIAESRIIIDPSTQMSKGVGFVRFETANQAASALTALNGVQLPSLPGPIHVKFAETPEDKAMRKRIQQQGMIMQQQQAVYSTGGKRFSPYATSAVVYQGGMPATMVSPMGMPQQTVNQYYAPQQTQQSYKQGKKPASGYSLFVYNLPFDTDESLLYQWFSPYGALASVRVIRNLSTGMCKGYGFVNYVKLEDAQLAILHMNGCPVGNKTLQVSFKVDDSK